MAVWEILPGQIWQGNIFSLALDFDACISCTKLSELLGPIDRFPLHLFFPFVDKDELPDLGELQLAAEFGVCAVAAGKRLLVNCNAGLNRSGLVIGSILGILDMTDIVSRIRQGHPEALTNKTFAAYLESLTHAN